MYKKTITYEDFDGAERTEDFYFHLSEAELIEMAASENGGLGNYMRRIVNEKNYGEMIKMFKELVLLSYGKRSDDGRRFIKNEAVRQEFIETSAYSAFFVELATNDLAASEFVNGLIPKKLLDRMGDDSENSANRA